MTNQTSSEELNRGLVQRIQNGPGEQAAFETLSLHLICRFKKHPMLHGLNKADRDEILEIEFLLRVWRGIKDFEYRGEGQFYSWLGRILKCTIIDHLRFQNRLQGNLPLISLNQEIDGEEGDKTEWIEIISCPTDDETDQKQREKVLEVAERCLSDKEFKLLEYRLTKQPLPSNWSESWIHTTWHRIGKKLIPVMKKREVP
jgi:DNA-directed RNA polymerase specialized sigma24 family protein